MQVSTQVYFQTFLLRFVTQCFTANKERPVVMHVCVRAHKQTCMRTGCAKRRGGSAFWLLLLFQFLFVSDGDSIPCSPHTASFVLTLAFLLSLSPFSLYLSIFSFLSSSLSFVILPFSDFKCRLPPVILVYFPLFSVIPFIIVHCLFSVVDCMQ